MASVFPVCVGTAHAATITSLVRVSGPGGTAVASMTTDPNNTNNDEYAGLGPADTNHVTLEKTFETIGYIDMVFSATNTTAEGTTDFFGDTTEYRFTGGAINNTGRVWSGFDILLGFGEGDTFVASGDGDFLDFDQPYSLGPLPVYRTRFPGHTFVLCRLA